MQKSEIMRITNDIFVALTHDAAKVSWREDLQRTYRMADKNYRHNANLTWILAGILFPLSLGLFAKGVELFYYVDWWQFALIGLAAIVLLKVWVLMYIRWGFGIEVSNAIKYGCEKCLGPTYISTRIYDDEDVRNNWFSFMIRGTHHQFPDIRLAWEVMIAGAIGLWLSLVVWKVIHFPFGVHLQLIILFLATVLITIVTYIVLNRIITRYTFAVSCFKHEFDRLYKKKMGNGEEGHDLEGHEVLEGG